MKRFTLCAAKYETDLRRFARKAEAAKIIYIHDNLKEKNGLALNVTFLQRKIFCEQLLAFLMDIAEGENPVYKNSSRLRTLARDLRDTPVFASELNLLEEFISSESALNIEGYVTFRMDGFHEKLDLLVYSIVKKIKFGI